MRQIMSAVDCVDWIEATLDEVLPREGARPGALAAAMRYAVGSGGKRVRPLVCLAAAVAAGGRAEDAKYLVCSQRRHWMPLGIGR